MSEVLLPLTITGRKYGYITWPKDKDPELRRLLGDGPVTLILPGGVERQRAPDWKHHRVSLGYSVTRPLPDDVQAIHLSAPAPGRIQVSFAKGPAPNPKIP